VRAALALVLVAVAVVLVTRALADRPAGESPPPQATPRPRAEATPRPRRRLRRARCPAGAANCEAVTGRVLYVEAVDPDGDGDAHYVLAGGDVTFPGVSVVDVSKALRPRRLPRRGDLVTAAGPVYEGSYGQRQIQATEVRHRRR
jgi:hypothetical protein